MIRKLRKFTNWELYQTINPFYQRAKINKLFSHFSSSLSFSLLGSTIFCFLFILGFCDFFGSFCTVDDGKDNQMASYDAKEKYFLFLKSRD